MSTNKYLKSTWELTPLCKKDVVLRNKSRKVRKF